jgi:hypothetical protein
MIRLNICVIFIFLFAIPSQSQNSFQKSGITRALSYQELLDEMVSCKDSIYELNDAIVQYNIEKDKRFVAFRDSLKLAQLDTLKVTASIKLNNVSFKDFEVGNKPSDNTTLLFTKIKFDDEVSITNTFVSNLIGFYKSKFISRFQITIDEASLDNEIYIWESIFNSYTLMTLEKGRILINYSEFNPINNQHSKFFDNAHLFVVNDESSWIQFGRSSICKNNELDNSQIGSKIYRLGLYDNVIETDFKLSEASIEDISMHNNEFQGLIDMTNVDFGSVKSEIFYEQIKNKVGVYSNEDLAASIWRPECYLYFKDEIASERLFSTFRRMTEYFKNRGNLKAYNAMFMEMKDMETMQLEYFYVKDKTVQNWFSWRMNQFLDRFSNYGTSPVKAILYAIQVILFFSLFFFFFHNTWDTFTKEQLMSRIKLLTKYFRSEEGIANLYEEQERHRYKSYEDFMAYMNEGESEIPRMFLWISKPLYKLSTLGITTTNKFLNKAELLNGKWIELGKGKKATAAFLGGLILFTHLLVSLLMKVLNAVMLSVNSFTTLGFGEIPTRGIGRYAAIIEGFMGWFLLTLFSVSLITQLLQ